jgi:DNA repair photolyase
MCELDTVSLVSPGAIGSCWYGNYNYVEPWIGCDHGCLYCYARSREVVQNTLRIMGTRFEEPALLYEEAAISEIIIRDIKRYGVKTVKLSRYTDIFSPKFVSNGMSGDIIEALTRSGVERIIITTKGAPDQRIIDTITQHPKLFSYNITIKPESENVLEPGVGSIDERMTAAAEIQRAGVLTTVHVDPILFSLYDSEHTWVEFFELLKGYGGFTRVMFSYMFLDESIIKKLACFGDVFNKAAYDYDLNTPFKYDDIDKPLYYLNAGVKKRHAEMLATLLRRLGLDFVLCSLKSAEGDHGIDTKHCTLCDGGFYA